MYILFGFLITGLFAQTSIHRIQGSPYPFSSQPDRLYLTSETFSYSQIIAVQSLQGILAKTKPEILRDIYGHKTLLAKQPGITIDQTYYTNFSGLLAHFANKVNGYILCTAKESSVNVAVSLSGILQAVAIPADIEQTAINAGLTKKLDVRGKDEAWMYTNYGSQFSKKIASYQNCSDTRALHLADYTSFAGGMQFWSSDPNSSLANNIYNTLDNNAAILGWGPSEGNTVEALSKKSIVIHPADWAPNLSTLTNIPVERFEQKDPVTPFKVVENVHTVCFVMSDGDNVQWLLGASDDKKTWADPNRAYANLGWTISPALAELAPVMYQKYVDNALTSVNGRNLLIAAPSGRGYFNPGIFPNLSAECDLLNKYMKRADLRIANVIDVDNSVRNPEPYLRQSNIDALFYYNYSNYAGLNGLLKWYKDKPSIAGKYTLWTGKTGLINDNTPTSLAEKLNTASTNILSAQGYSLIPVIVWSNDVNAVLDCIGKLGPNVRVVAPDEFVWLLRKNLRNLPMGTGNGLKAEYFQGSAFNTLESTRIDRAVDFDWGSGSPDVTNLGSDGFSLRWSGQIQPLYTQNYTFYATADGGSKLTINGTVLFDALTTEGTNTQTGTISLTAGEKYSISLEYVEQTGNASCMLEWVSTSQSRQVVPQIQLYTEPVRAATSTGVVTAFANTDFGGFSAGLKVGDYTLEDMKSVGLLDNDVASIKVGMGFKVVLYEEDHFGGKTLEVTAETANLGEWIDKTSSIKVLTNGVTNLEGTYYLVNRSSKFNLDIAGGVGGVDNGATVQQWNVTENLNQRFKLKHLGNGCYSVIAAHSNKGIEVKANNLNNGAYLDQWTYFGGDHQQYIIVSTGDGYHKLIAKHSGKIIEVVSNTIEAKARQWTDTNQTRGQWFLNKVPELKNGGGDGLDADYYTGTNFTQLKNETVDETINFNWGNEAPNTSVGADNFSVRWTGKIQPRTSGVYTFYITSDNGRRLYIDNELIIDKWISDYDIEYSGTVSLEQYKFYDIRLDYFEENGGANCKLEWSSLEQPREIVPKSQLYSQFNSIDQNTLSPDHLILYPVPVSEKILNVLLSGSNQSENSMLTIYDLVGKPVFTTNFCQKASLDLSKLQSGSYIVSVQNKNQKLNKSIVIQ